MSIFAIQPAGVFRQIHVNNIFESLMSLMKYPTHTTLQHKLKFTLKTSMCKHIYQNACFDQRILIKKLNFPSNQTEFDLNGMIKYSSSVTIHLNSFYPGNKRAVGYNKSYKQVSAC